MWISRLKRVRKTIVVLGIANLAVIVSGGVLTLVSNSNCDSAAQLFPLYAVCVAACVKLAVMVKVGSTQELMAMTIMESPTHYSLERKMKYKTWLWWTRFAMVITLLQFIGATYLMFRVSTFVSPDGLPRHCVLDTRGWKQTLQVAFLITVCFVALAQCFTGSDILQWRSFYATQDDAWKAHYQEVFDHGIREVLCCLGRREYMGVIEEDEVCSVARLLGDLVSYRASGTGHLEFLAGLALLQNNNQFPESHEDCIEAPAFPLQEAATLHKFAEAAYTGPLLDVGRNPALFLCTWICRQGILTPWSRKWRPKLDGDNWWRGHAAAFLKFIDFPAHVLRRGRICSEKCKATYFVVVLHYLRCVVIAVRGTETAEDLITDGLGRACSLTDEDLEGLTNHIHVMDSSRTHYGHSGIVEAARDLFMQIEGEPKFGESESIGFLSSLIGDGCECDGYSIRIVGHSLGGAIASLLGVRLRSRFPNLYVYAYGPLPCVDSDVAEASSEFVTSIVLDNEFSSRLSYGSIRRLQVAALKVLSQDPKADTALIFRLARRFLSASKRQRQNVVEGEEAIPSSIITVEDSAEAEVREHDEEFINPFHELVASTDNPVTQFMETVPTRGGEEDDEEEAPEMFLPGLVIHIVPEVNNMSVPIWRGWPICDVTSGGYKAYVAKRESFKELMVSPSMFLDHLPWRCRHAMHKVLESRNLFCDLTSEPDIVV
ncbi:PREDICTED: sn1-specific diacylglycerol lipase beta-like isoform X3 [Brassica oleracea var. oleracea]|uniref:sn1-specific diacylglycerol lipase beta-like isoform X3 n=1 Tax=Brassica oleracea var. oleracea TaxID=109376 RepID=UPI0006A6F328|nr:PREDICTED: sn1-specific diacylglycerol lipase beta-like isoform X3 [Brassica oleracea var. oleracea]